MASSERYLGTVHVRFSRPEAAGLLSGDDLDALADALIEIRDVVTVRVESAGAPTVYRIDLEAGKRDGVDALAAAPVDAVCHRLGLVAELISVTVV